MPERVPGLTVTINGNKPTSISSRVIAAVMEQAEQIDRSPYADVTIKVQDGKPAMVEITTKHKPSTNETATGYISPEAVRQMEAIRLPFPMWSDTPKREDLRGRPCFAGLVGSTLTGPVTLVLVFPRIDAKLTWHVLPFYAVPTETVRWWVKHGVMTTKELAYCRDHITTHPGQVVEANAIHNLVAQLAQEFDIQEIAYDPWSTRRHITEASTILGIQLVQMRLVTATLTEPIRTLQDLHVLGLVTSGGHPALMKVEPEATITKDAHGNAKLEAPAPTKTTALLLAMSRALAHTNNETTAP